MSLAKLGRATNYARGHLSQVERGIKNATHALALACDNALDAEGGLVELVAARERGSGRSGRASVPSLVGDVRAGRTGKTRETGAVGTDEPGEQPRFDTETGMPSWDLPWVLRMSASGSHEFRVGPTDPASPDAAALGFAAMTWGPAPQLGTGEAAPAISHFRRWFDTCRVLGQVYTPAMVTGLVVTTVGTLWGAANSARGDDRATLLRLAARFAEYAGWMTQEAGDDRGSLAWTRQAVALAEAGGDPLLAAYAIVRQAEIALYLGDAHTTVELARHAARQAESPRIRALAAQREAQGHALMGRRTASLAALDRAGALAASLHETGGENTEDVPAFGSTYLSQADTFVTGWCLQDLGRASDAVDLLSGGLEAIDPQARRARARYGARLALALAEAGDLDQACAVTATVAPAVAAVDSATIRIDLRRLNHVLNRRGDRRTRETTALIAQALRRPRTT